MDNLKPCPGGHGIPKLEKQVLKTIVLWKVSCANDHCWCISKGYLTEEEAVDAWNKMILWDDRLDPCPRCGGKPVITLDDYMDEYTVHCSECDHGYLHRYNLEEVIKCWNAECPI